MESFRDMAALKDILPLARRILRQHNLCDHCLGRMFSKRLGLSSNKLLGRRLNSGRAEKCYICRDVYFCLEPLLQTMLDASSGCDFETFTVGAQIKPSIVDRDDLVRSKFRLAGTDGIKTDITRDLSRQFSRKTKKTPDATDPDITFTVNIKDRTCQMWIKPVMVQGRYTKNERGIPQKQRRCANCCGSGCHACSFHGIDEFESVEGMISKMLISKFDCTTIGFTWIGGEDRSSLVLGDGRPFFAKVNCPSRRHPRFSRRTELGPTSLHGCKILRTLPSMPIRFSSAIRMRVSAECPVDTVALRRLRTTLRAPVAVYDDSGRRSEKSVSRVRYKRLSDCDFVLSIDAEGGLPIKRFVEGDNVSPGISQILGVACRCVRFDFVDVRTH